MDIQLNFPDDLTLIPGNTVAGTVRFWSKDGGMFASLNVEVRLLVRLERADHTIVLKAHELARNISFSADEARTFPVSFVVPEFPAFTGQLFMLQPQLRGFVYAANRGNSALQRHLITDYVRETVVDLRLKLSSVTFGASVDLQEEGEKAFRLELALLLPVFFVLMPYAFSPVAGVIGLLILVLFGYWYIVAEENSVAFKPRKLEVVDQRHNGFLMKLKVEGELAKISSLRSGYFVQEFLRHRGKDGYFYTRKSVAQSPGQTLQLAADGTAFIEHQYLPQPGGFNAGTCGLNWIYFVEATLNSGQVFRWEGPLTEAGEGTVISRSG
ncbi:MAG: hypothetical protein AAF597_03525 [Bacteroidota bacterium]